jgi:hypothetical protein
VVCLYVPRYKHLYDHDAGRVSLALYRTKPLLRRFGHVNVRVERSSLRDDVVMALTKDQETVVYHKENDLSFLPRLFKIQGIAKAALGSFNSWQTPAVRMVSSGALRIRPTESKLKALSGLLILGFD